MRSLISQERVVSISVTERGRQAALRLPFPVLHGEPALRLAEAWEQADAVVAFLPVGATVRLIAPLIGRKGEDPAVVCVDEASRFVVSLLGGHRAKGMSANELANAVAALLGATAVVTTGTDSIGICPLDALPGFRAHGDLASVSRSLLDGCAVQLDAQMEWPLPPALVDSLGGPPTKQHAQTPASGPRVIVTDEDYSPGCSEVVLHPESLVVGVGCDTSCEPKELVDHVVAQLSRVGLSPSSVGWVATVDRRSGHPAILALAEQLDAAVVAFPPDELAKVPVANPSPAVERAIGTPSVAEAAALMAGGDQAVLVSAKHASTHSTVALVRRRRPPGKVAVVGLGPGSAMHRTPAASVAVLHADVVIGYSAYVDQCADLLRPWHRVRRFAIGEEAARARHAVSEARSGRKVALVCSGDASVFAMAAMTIEAASGAVQVEVVPGLTAAHAAASLIGAPLSHDHALISLSDLTTSWETIAQRIEATASTNMALALYNPASKRRAWQLSAALDIIARHRSGTTPVGLVTDATRPGQQVEVTTLDELRCDSGLLSSRVTMTTCVIVGSADTCLVGSSVVTPRGRPLR